MTTKSSCWADGRATLTSYTLIICRLTSYHFPPTCTVPFHTVTLQASISPPPVLYGLSIAQPRACERVDVTTILLLCQSWMKAWTLHSCVSHSCTHCLAVY